MAGLPYPQELETDISIPGLGKFHMRPVKPGDESAFAAFTLRMKRADTRMRFFSPFKALPEALISRLTHIDYDREMAFVLFDAKGNVGGVGRLSTDADNARAEFALIVRSDLKHHGMGRFLLERLIAYAKSHGISEIFGDVLAENDAMLTLAREMGCEISIPPMGIVRATLILN
jgi:acetyltransferase